ncbi:DUF3783 domain-containing protein [[Eubacterium] cellulosolvens]
MESLGILIYGYNSEDAKAIEQSLSSITNQDIVMISGSKKEDLKIMDILDIGPEDEYEERKNKILLFLGFSEAQVGAVLKEFPKSEKLHRPIFCGLTEENINWTLEYLMEHLVEEDKYWKDKKEAEKA